MPGNRPARVRTAHPLDIVSHLDKNSIIAMLRETYCELRDGGCRNGRQHADDGSELRAVQEHDEAVPQCISRTPLFRAE
jgi:hypothetical protein